MRLQASQTSEITFSFLTVNKNIEQTRHLVSDHEVILTRWSLRCGRLKWASSINVTSLHRHTIFIISCISSHI